MRPVPFDRLLPVLTNGNEAERYGVLAVFRRLGTNASPAIPEIRTALLDSNPTVRKGAAACLSEVADPAPSIMAALKPALADPCPGVRLEAAKAWWKLGGESLTAVSTITNSLLAFSPDTVVEAMRALREIRTEAAVPTFVALLANPRTHIRFKACEALAEISPTNTFLIPATLNVITNDKVFHRSGVELLAKLSHRSSEARSALHLLASQPDRELRGLASKAIESYNSSATNN